MWSMTCGTGSSGIFALAVAWIGAAQILTACGRVWYDPRSRVDGSPASDSSVSVDSGPFADSAAPPRDTSVISSDAWIGDGGDPLSEFTRRKRLEVPAGTVSEDLADFPLLVSIAADPDLARDALSSGADLRFVWPADRRLLPYEIEEYESSTGRLVAWVRVPLIAAASATSVDLYFGNPTATSAASPTVVWSDYELVLHMSDEGGPRVRDSVNPAISAMPEGAVAHRPAMVGSGLQFGTSSVPEPAEVKLFGTEGLMNGRAAFTVSFWARVDYPTDADWELSRERKLFELPTTFMLMRTWHRATEPGPGRFQGDVHFDVGIEYPNMEFVREQWQLIAFRYDGAAMDAFMDGVPALRVALAGARLDSTATQWLTLGNASESFFGMLDELRFSEAIRSNAWLTAEHANQASPSTFVLVGPLETL